VDITYRLQHFLDHAPTPHQLNNRAPHGVEAKEGYIRWFYRVSHPHMILPHEDVQVPRTPEQKPLMRLLLRRIEIKSTWSCPER
jgi:hypothetical protein